MLWFGDNGQILDPVPPIKWGYTWGIDPERWNYSVGDPATITPTAGEIAAVGYFTVCKIGGTYSNFFGVNRSITCTYPGFGIVYEAPVNVGDVCALEASSGVLQETPVLLTGLLADAYIDPSYVYHPPQGFDSLTFGVYQTTADWEFEEFDRRKKVTVTKEAVTGSPTNIPVMVEYTGDENEFYWVLTNQRYGAMLKMTDADGVEIPCEAGTVSSADYEKDIVRLFFLAPKLSSSEDTDFYVYYSSEKKTDRTFNPGDLWIPNREGVWHEGFGVVWNGIELIRPV